MSNNKINLITYLDKGAIIIFYISAAIILIGYIIDIFTFKNVSKDLFIINFSTVILVIVLVILYFLKKLSLKISYGIILYATIVNIFFDTFTNPYLPSRLDFLMRDAIFIIIALSLASLVINKIHSIIITFIYLAGLTAFILLTGNSFLKDSIFLIIIIVTAYAGVVYYFVSVIEKAISSVEEDSSTIRKQSEEVNKSYELLLVHQQKIEKQSKELIEQSKILQEQSELLQEQNAELNRLIATKNKFFSILAHDLKNPFNSILGFAELLDMKFSILDDNKKQTYVGNIKKTAIKTYSLLESLLLWARTQSNNMDYNPQSFLIIPLIDSILTLYENKCIEKKLKLLINIDEKCKVYADIDHVEIILKNLFSNAVKYTPAEGTICVDYKIIAPWVEISVTDSGIGMSDEEIESLFRIEKDRRKLPVEGESGSGLGLIISSELVKKQGGILSAKSQMGMGSTFSFTLPIGKK